MSGGHAGQGTRDVIGKSEAFSSQAIDIRCLKFLTAIATEHVTIQTVEQEHHGSSRSVHPMILRVAYRTSKPPQSAGLNQVLLTTYLRWWRVAMGRQPKHAPVERLAGSLSYSRNSSFRTQTTRRATTGR